MANKIKTPFTESVCPKPTGKSAMPGLAPKGASATKVKTVAEFTLTKKK